MKSARVLILATVLGCGPVFAGLIIGGGPLNDSHANQLETWLGVGDQDFTNIWSGTAGVSTAGSFHAAADGAGPTISIYSVTTNFGAGPDMLIGGYTSLSWGGSTGYQSDPTAFIFNLDSLEFQQALGDPSRSVYRNPNYFPTFGTGHDIFAGIGLLATVNGSVSFSNFTGYTNSNAYDSNQGQISVAGDFGAGSGSSGISFSHIAVQTLDVYTFAPAAAVAVPEASGLFLLLIAGTSALLLRRRITRG